MLSFSIILAVMNCARHILYSVTNENICKGLLKLAALLYMLNNITHNTQSLP